MQVINEISKQTGRSKKEVLHGVLILLVLLIVFGVGQHLLTNLVGAFYPAFMSFYALESPGIDDDKQWLTYWSVFGIFSLCDQFSERILSIIPFYFVLKVLLLIWLFHPSTLGAQTVYY